MFEDIHFIGWLVTGLMLFANILCGYLLYKVIKIDEE